MAYLLAPSMDGPVGAKPDRRQGMSSSLAEAAASRGRQKRDDETEKGGIAADRLGSVIERIERLEEERKALGSDIKDVYAEAKSAGFNVSVIRQLNSYKAPRAIGGRTGGVSSGHLRRALGM